MSQSLGNLPNPYPEFDTSHVYNLDQEVDGGLWKNLWDICNDDTDPLQIAGEFYLLQAIAAGFIGDHARTAPFKDHTLDEIMNAASLLNIGILETQKRVIAGKDKEEAEYDPLYPIEQEALAKINELCDTYLLRFKNYIDMACGGELRHHAAFNEGGLLHGIRRVAWSSWYFVREKYGTESLDVAAKYFRDFSGSGYGGERWATGPDLLAAYERKQLGSDEASNNRMFMDRVFTLVHNNGCMLNKLNWANKRTDEDTHFWSLENMQTILDAHASDDPDFDTLLSVCGEDVKNLYEKYHKVIRELKENNNA